jgi:hypothetical protein
MSRSRSPRLGLLGCVALAGLPGASHAQAPAPSSAAPLPSSAVPAAPRSARAREIADAIAGLDVERARQLVQQAGSAPDVALERARLAIYLGDCDTASAIAASLPKNAGGETAEVVTLSRNCARATAAATIEEHRDKGVWIRLQDDEDGALVPFVIDVADRARASAERDLGTRLPRPLRIDLVRDLFSLAALSGLPLEAAETTGTVAVARWGRVTMVSPRATALGYPWQDTLAHEIAHLVISRATRDHAPLWLQEGLAKREETRWRPERPFDRQPDPDEVALAALIDGRSLGVQGIGPSIALLPTPEAASIAFAEVASFVEWWIGENGSSALHLLLADLQGIGSDDAAMKSVTGWPVAAWIERWRRALLERFVETDRRREAVPRRAHHDAFDLARRTRLGDLLWRRGHGAPAAAELAPALEANERAAALRWRLGRAWRAAGETQRARQMVQRFDDVHGLHGGWCALHAWFLSKDGDAAAAENAFGLARAIDPFSEAVACRGELRMPGAAPPHDGGAVPPLPIGPAERALCEAARRGPPDP